ncbi:uncharacterized protein LOC129594183 [Paramacrobiotus metropolitanus]|uniref:uncharacterized protein LOC129594183 n=1 Tax=Paramacrobiotus metropolitanus TaxID=2943436 RepID=UPI002445BAAB|nr:uncharacterized protein LOC129594183 [Paramacrobiotus metropolitanus]
MSVAGATADDQPRRSTDVGSISSVTSKPLRAPPLLIPAQSRAVHLPKGFRRLLDDFSREVLRQRPCNIYQFGADYFACLLCRRKQGLSIFYEPNISYIRAQLTEGNRIVVPTIDQNLKGTQTSGSYHYFVPDSDLEDMEKSDYGFGLRVSEDLRDAPIPVPSGPLPVL